MCSSCQHIVINTLPIPIPIPIHVPICHVTSFHFVSTEFSRIPSPSTSYTVSFFLFVSLLLSTRASCLSIHILPITHVGANATFCRFERNRSVRCLAVGCVGGPLLCCLCFFLSSSCIVPALAFASLSVFCCLFTTCCCCWRHGTARQSWELKLFYVESRLNDGCALASYLFYNPLSFVMSFLSSSFPLLISLCSYNVLHRVVVVVVSWMLRADRNGLIGKTACGVCVKPKKIKHRKKSQTQLIPFRKLQLMS